MPPKVVDTGVWVVSDGSEDLDLRCVEACVEFLATLDVNGRNRLVVDGDYRIFGEYRRNIRPGGFAEAVLNTIQQLGTYDFVFITQTDRDYPRDGRAGEWFAQIPKGAGLEELDPSDRKFMAVALGHPARPPIVYSVDIHDWKTVESAAAEQGVELEPLCRHLFKDL